MSAVLDVKMTSMLDDGFSGGGAPTPEANAPLQNAPHSDEDPNQGDELTTGAAAGQKKRKKKKKGGQSTTQFVIPELDNSELRRVGNWPAANNSPIDFPPSIPIRSAFRKGTYPVGECIPYTDSFCATSVEKREAEKLLVEDYADIRRAAECHRQVRKYVQSWIRPGMTMLEICQRLEAKTVELIQAEGLEAGFGFPTGCSLNHCAAHYTPNYGEDDVVLNRNDICKLDFGVHVKGRIIDCAFSVAFDPIFDPLIQSTQDATNAGLKAAGIDVRFYEVSREIEEVIRSFEMEIQGKLVPIRPIANLNGHSINRYQIHGGKSVPIVDTHSVEKMEEGEIYAIETFASTGRGRVAENGRCSHYMKTYDEYVSPAAARAAEAKKLLQAIEHNFGTLAFCRRWLDDRGEKRHLLALRQLVDANLVTPYPPLCDIEGCFTSQMEHTVLLRPTCKEVVSRGPDF